MRPKDTCAPRAVKRTQFVGLAQRHFRSLYPALGSGAQGHKRLFSNKPLDAKATGKWFTFQRVETNQ